MSGGYFNYTQNYIFAIANDIEELIRANNVKILDGFGNPIGRNFNDATIREFRKGVRYLRMAGAYAQRIDWLMSGDDGEDTFISRLEEDLKEFNDKT